MNDAIHMTGLTLTQLTRNFYIMHTASHVNRPSRCSQDSVSDWRVVYCSNFELHQITSRPTMRSW